jgi:hypothetical protein
MTLFIPIIFPNFRRYLRSRKDLSQNTGRTRIQPNVGKRKKRNQEKSPQVGQHRRVKSPQVGQHRRVLPKR